ncbi:hypothetical protein HZH66_001515 [Vespula vulgaris]|uniref:Uncharacterized protein n=1 Tax=Vespula vulgaris TaxID=7454 RepID=A0A834KWQ4_VESVU|nr:hypothetical protein HZH66_001515 [Vespula vulgaris]
MFLANNFTYHESFSIGRFKNEEISNGSDRFHENSSTWFGKDPPEVAGRLLEIFVTPIVEFGSGTEKSCTVGNGYDKH